MKQACSRPDSLLGPEQMKDHVDHAGSTVHQGEQHFGSYGPPPSF